MTTTLTPAEAWTKLIEGNRRFVAGISEHPNQDAHRRAEIAGGQNPFATFLGCSDSRVAAETLFDVGLGDLFTTRNAGQMVTDSAVASIEFAVAMLDVPLLVVLAHDSCGAVAAAVRGTAIDAEPIPPKIWKLIAPIVPAARRVLKESGGTTVEDIDPEEVGREHLRGTILGLLESSEIISDAVAEGRLAIVGAKYRLTDGSAVPIAQVGLADSDIPSLSKEQK
ncbi:MAG TPA: carbonic anhydrase [Microbacterium sp.]|uniref:carbonic anhydrase n=1 Tax=Microbacterium TaxID=33882 RepID=UPI0009696F4A|nr:MULTISPECIES: carbonic anhydrase [Microbacterium]OJU39908.1 MAG: carbonic anhydrase [Microbacterium sp. 69-10]GLC85067.1 carbonic anhydrase [Microbacterium arabinogalactanolyticum]HWU27513.1 carbonic anhydrase [Microbacterium sp.]